MEASGSTPAEPPSPGGPAASLSVDIVDDRGLLDPARRRWLRERAIAALGPLDTGGEVRARIVDDAEMAGAHQRWSGVAGTTDVLTFDLREAGPGAGPLDVDLLICADQARRQAEARGFAVERELLLYIVHGVLHCLGHDDHDEAAAARMHAEEDRLLEAAGVGATYAPGGSSAGGRVARAEPRTGESL
jgi:probable rRNA maturation factor